MPPPQPTSGSLVPINRMGVNRVRVLVGLALLAVFAFAVALTLIEGRKGYMPLDHSIVFDGAWRVLRGQVPYRDFTTPNGLTPIYLQVPFFALLGPTWFAYVLHAALANGAFALLVYALLRRFALERPFALAYSIASAVVFYPPIGVPYMEQESFLFSLAAIVAAAWATAAEPDSRRAQFLWTAATLALAAAWCSKQIPSVFALPIVLAILVAAARAPRRPAVVALVVTSLAVVVALAASALIAGVDGGLFFDYAWRLPRAEGEQKLHYAGGAFNLFRRAHYTVRDAGCASLYVHYTAPMLALGAALAARFASPERRVAWLRAAAAWGLAAATIWTCLGFVAFTGNQWQNGVPFVFLALGLVHAGLRSGAGAAGSKFVLVFGLAATALAAYDAWNFQRDVNETRMVNDLVYSADVAEVARPYLPEELEFLEWSLPGVYSIGPREFGELVKFLREREKGYVLLGDLTILHALTDATPLEPCLWLHPGLTMPWPDDPAFAAFDARWAAPFLDGRARWLVVLADESYTKRRLEQFPSLAELVKTKSRRELHFGTIRVIDLAP